VLDERAPLVERVLDRQVGEETPELASGGAQETAVAGDPHQHLGNTERDDLRVGQLAPRVVRPLGQEIVARGVETDAEQADVGVNRVPPGRRSG
jgi:hypothetical protein